MLMLVFVSLVKLTYKYYFITKLVIIFGGRGDVRHNWSIKQIGWIAST